MRWPVVACTTWKVQGYEANRWFTLSYCCCRSTFVAVCDCVFHFNFCRSGPASSQAGGVARPWRGSFSSLGRKGFAFLLSGFPGCSRWWRAISRGGSEAAGGFGGGEGLRLCYLFLVIPVVDCLLLFFPLQRVQGSRAASTADSTRAPAACIRWADAPVWKFR